MAIYVDEFRVRGRLPRTAAEHQLFRSAKERRDIRQRLRAMKGRRAAYQQALAIAPDNATFALQRDALETRIRRLTKEHNALKQAEERMTALLLRARMNRASATMTPVTPVPVYDLRVRRRRRRAPTGT